MISRTDLSMIILQTGKKSAIDRPPKGEVGCMAGGNMVGSSIDVLRNIASARTEYVMLKYGNNGPGGQVR